MVEFNETSFRGALSRPGAVLADFWAPWCGPCARMGPVLEGIAAEYGDRAVIGRVNTDELPELTLEAGISAIPTIILFRDGRETARFVGVTPREALARALDSIL